MATWEQVQQNPALYPQALQSGEGERLHWHRHADQPHVDIFHISMPPAAATTP